MLKIVSYTECFACMNEENFENSYNNIECFWSMAYKEKSAQLTILLLNRLPKHDRIFVTTNVKK